MMWLVTDAVQFICLGRPFPLRPPCSLGTLNTNAESVILDGHNKRKIGSSRDVIGPDPGGEGGDPNDEGSLGVYFSFLFLFCEEPNKSANVLQFSEISKKTCQILLISN